jgi:hypothetical protein
VSTPDDDVRATEYLLLPFRRRTFTQIQKFAVKSPFLRNRSRPTSLVR